MQQWLEMVGEKGQEWLIISPSSLGISLTLEQLKTVSQRSLSSEKAHIRRDWEWEWEKTNIQVAISFSKNFSSYFQRLQKYKWVIFAKLADDKVYGKWMSMRKKGTRRVRCVMLKPMILAWFLNGSIVKIALEVSAGGGLNNNVRDASLPEPEGRQLTKFEEILACQIQHSQSWGMQKA